MKKIILILFLLSTTACATKAKYKAKLQTWIGQHYDQIVSSWGPPTNSARLTNGGQVIEYYKERFSQSGGYSYPVAQTVRSSRQVTSPRGRVTRIEGNDTIYTDRFVPLSNHHWWCKTRFTIDPNHIISHWAVEGNDCRSR